MKWELGVKNTNNKAQASNERERYADDKYVNRGEEIIQEAALAAIEKL